MSMWPETLKVGPLREWPGQLKRMSERRASPFRATLSATLRTLDKELYELVDTKVQQDSAELLLAIPAGAFRLDGRPRADAHEEHPGVILSLDSRHGHLSYPCDTFTTWQDNLRAIALALEALRKVDRYGVTSRGEQYRGFLAIEGATAMPAGFATAASAREFIGRLIVAAEWTTDATDVRLQVRQAKRLTHPDAGGDTATFQRVTLAEAKLREEGLL